MKKNVNKIRKEVKSLKMQIFLFLGMPISFGVCGKPELCQVVTL